MTKLKNTKKGMAKKALSISLVAAMLATSNVPVWAAEDLFSDGSGVTVEAEAPAEDTADADIFSSSEEPSDAPAEVAAPAAEEIDENGVQLAAATGSYYLSNVSHSANIDWMGNVLDDPDLKFDQANKIFTTGSNIIDQSTELPVAAAKLKYVWRIGGTWVGTAGDFADFTSIALPTMDKTAVGKTLDLYLYEAGDAQEDSVLTLDFGTIKAVDVAGTETLAFPAAGFTGKDVTLEPNSVTTTLNGVTLDASDFTWSHSGTDGLKNAGSVITVTGEVTPKAAEDKGITGTVTGSYTIDKVAITATDITVKVNEAKKSYSYTGAKINIPVENVSVTYKDTGYDLSGYVKSVQTVSSAAANGVALTVTLGKDKLTAAESNFNYTAATDLQTTTTADNGKVNITVLNLNECTVEMLQSYKTKPTTPLVYGTDYIVKKDGVELSLSNDVNAVLADSSADAYKTPGVYNNAVVVTTKSGNVTGTNYANLTITTLDFSNGDFKDSDFDLIDTDDVNNAGLTDNMKYTGKAPSYGPAKGGIATQLGGFYAAFADSSPIDSAGYNVTFENVDSVSTEHLAKVTVTGKSDYAGCKKVLYFKIVPADVTADNAANSVVNSITTKIPATGIGIEQNDAFTKPEQYKDAIGLAITAKADEDKASTTTPKQKISVPLTEGKDYTVSSYKFTSDINGTAWTSSSATKYVEVKADITSKNVAVSSVNDVIYSNGGVVVNLTAATTTPKAPAKLRMYVKVVEKSLENAEITLDKETYTYTGKKIEPTATVTLGGKTLVKDKDYTVSTLNAINAGSAKVVINGKGEYRGKAEKAFTIEKADASALKLALKTGTQVVYNGTQKTLTLTGAANDADIKLADFVVSSQFAADELTYGDNINAGKEAGTLTVTPSKDNKNFKGTATLSFEILPFALEGTVNETIDIYNANGKKLTNNALGSLDWTGKAAAFNKANVNLNKITNKPAAAPNLAAKDVEVVYVNNVDASTVNPDAKAYIAAVGKGNYTGTYSIVKNAATGEISAMETAAAERANTNAPGTYEILQSGIIKDSINSFLVEGKKFGSKDITVKNGVYAGGLTVLPEVTVVRDGKTLVQDVDYTIEVVDARADTKNASTTPIKIRIVGIGQYNGVSVSKDVDGKDLAYTIEKKDLKDCFVSVNTKDDKLNVTVMNGNVIEKKETFDVKADGDGKATVSVVGEGKNYTGSVTVEINDTGDVGQAMIADVKVSGNNATVILSGAVENASGYDYVISTEEDYKNGRVAINKNTLLTKSSFQYLPEGTYYTYLHAWKRGADGKKDFGAWSNLFEFTIEATTPEQPMITSVKVKGSTVTVTYTKSKDATGYDIVLGKSAKKVNGEKRPVNYGKLVKKVYSGNTVTATFKNVPAGTYYAGLHAYNRSRADKKKVFSPWSNTKQFKVN